MDLLATQRAVSAGNFRSLWVDMIKSVPPCGDCGAPSTHVLQLYAQDPPSYLCSRNECVDRMRADNSQDPAVLEGWKPTLWIDHVLAAELSCALRK